MPLPRRFELDELVLRPGTYFNPETEVLIVVDDSPEVDQAIFDAEPETEGGEWVLVADDVPLDEAARDELVERFQARYHDGAAATGPLGDEEAEELDEDEEPPSLDDEDEEEDDDGAPPELE
jgi:hypothetical protein